MNKADNFLFKIFGLPYLFARQPLATIERVLRVVGQIDNKKSLNILDVGCGSGIFSFMLSKKGHKVIGLDRKESQDKLNFRSGIINKKYKGNTVIFGCDIRFFDFSQLGSDFDYVICTEVIEHILDDNRLIKEIAGILKKDGVLLLTAPYKNYVRFKYDTISYIEDGGHVRWGYDLEDFEKLCQNNNLKIVWNGFISGYISQKLIHIHHWLASRVGDGLAIIITYPLRSLVLIDYFVTRIKNYPYLSIAIKARKI